MPAAPSRFAPALAALLLALAIAGCAASRSARWDGRRGYDGNGDYGYDLTASRAAAQTYRVRAARAYPAPGTPDDPWGPYIREAAVRFSVPEGWIRAVLVQESGGNLYDADGGLVTSAAGAMGLMQVMPTTYDMLRERYGLGADPYAPRDNILAGTAYIREMYDRYGAPGFLAAYNAGPDRVDAARAGGVPLPAETVGYVASVAPRLAGVDADRAYAGGGMTGADYAATRQVAQTGNDPPLRTVAVVSRPAAGDGDWAVQVGAFPDAARAAAAIAAARSEGGTVLEDSGAAITQIWHGGLLFRARLIGLSATAASAACAQLAAQGLACFAVPPGS